jgi:hypothetical protein
MLPPLINANGSLRTTPAEPDGLYMGGIAVTHAGEVCISENPPEGFSNGHGTTSSGALSIAPGGEIAGYSAGLPVTSSGALVTTELPGPGAHVGGLLITPDGVLVEIAS